MEILNNIWHMLTTENELYTKILIIPFGFIEEYLSLLLFSTVLNIKYNKRQLLTFIFLSVFIMAFSGFFIPSPINVFINYIFIFILVFKLFNLSIIKTSLSIIVPQLTYGLIATLIINPMLSLFNSTFQQFNIVPIYRIIYLSTSYLLMFIIILIFKYKNIAVNFLEDLDKSSKKIFIVNLIIGFAVLLIQALTTYYYVSVFSLIATFFSFLSLLAYFGISFYSLTRVIKLQTTTRDLENAESYNETLQTLYDNVKSFKHDFDNMIHMLDGYLKNDDMKGLKEYYYDLTKDYDRVNAISVLNPNVINNPGIYNMLVSKYKLASDCDVKLHIEFFMDFNSLHMPIYEFSRVLGILLDNAIEAASECDDKIVNIMFRTSSRDNVELVKIENTFKNKDIDLKTIFKKDTSTKEKHMGMGLWEVNQIVNRFNNIKLVPSKDGQYFCQQLEIYY